MTERAARRTIMVIINGVLQPKKIALRRHNKNKPKRIKPGEKMKDRKEITNEDSDSRAQRSNEYSLHSAPKISVNKVRLKHKVTGATVGIFDDHKKASIAHAAHPMKNKLFVENFFADKISFVKELMGIQESEKFVNVATSQKAISSAKKALEDSPDMWSGPKAGFKRQISVHTKHIENAKKTKNESISFSEYCEIFEEQSELLETKLNEAKEEINKLQENAFNWKSTPREVDWTDGEKKKEVTKKPEVAKKPEVSADAPKRGRGRPPGKYGTYKVDGRSAGDKAAIGSKVHSNPDRKAKYDDTIAARKEFKNLMNNAIKNKQNTQ